MNGPPTGTGMAGPTGTKIDGSVVAEINNATVKGKDNSIGTQIASSTGTWTMVP